MKGIRATFGTLLTTLFVAIPCLSQEPSPQKLELGAILSAASKTKSFSCDFVQEKHLSMLKKPAVTKGSLHYLKPDHLRLDQKEPTQVSFLVNGKKLKRWEEKRTDASTAELSKDIGLSIFANQVFAWHNGDVDWLSKRYDITVIMESPPTALLVPIEKTEKGFITQLKVTFSEDLTLVEKVEVEAKKKDTITTTFQNCTIDPSFPKDLFQ
jgi:outer membrane lipoprotein-sorting protein